MKRYHQLNREERYQIEKQLQEGKRPGQVALSMGFHRSTIYRELRRNCLRRNQGYSAREAWRRTLSNRRRQDFGPVLKIKGWVRERLLDGLSMGWSPANICGRLKLERNFSLSAEAVYKFLLKDRNYGGELYKCLRRAGKRRRLQKRSRFVAPRIARKFIEERPENANSRAEVGHWERDLMVSAEHKGGLLVITDRKTRYTLLDRVRTLDSEETLKATVNRFKRAGDLECKTITNDNGCEFAAHSELENILGIKVYFARPYSSWQRGSNENVIGLIRQFLPKGSDVHEINEERLRQIEYAINTRPRKMFGFRSAHELMYKKNLKLCPRKQHRRYEEESLRKLFLSTQ